MRCIKYMFHFLNRVFTVHRYLIISVFKRRKSKNFISLVLFVFVSGIRLKLFKFLEG